MGALHRTRRWRTLRDQVVREEPWCRLQIPGVCTGRSETGDHIMPAAHFPELFYERTNVQGACHACNQRRSDTPLEDLELDDDEPEALSIFRV